jgi:hypothetical protein
LLQVLVSGTVYVDHHLAWDAPETGAASFGIYVATLPCYYDPTHWANLPREAAFDDPAVRQQHSVAQRIGTDRVDRSSQASVVSANSMMEASSRSTLSFMLRLDQRVFYRLEIRFRGEGRAADGVHLQRLCLDDPIVERLMLRILAARIFTVYELNTGHSA